MPGAHLASPGELDKMKTGVIMQPTMSAAMRCFCKDLTCDWIEADMQNELYRPYPPSGITVVGHRSPLFLALEYQYVGSWF